MGRKISFLIVGLILMGLAGEVRAQENLDTLWTRTIGGAGNDVFYAMARGNDGNVLVCAFLDGMEGHAAGRYVIEIEPDGDINPYIPIPSEFQFTSLSGFRETEGGGIELSFYKFACQFSRTGELLNIDTLGYDEDTLIEEWHNYFERHYRTTGNKYIGDDTYAVWGTVYERAVYQGGSYTIDGPWTHARSIITGQRFGGCYGFPCSMFFPQCTSYLESELDDNQTQVEITHFCEGAGSESWQSFLPTGTASLRMFAGLNSMPYVGSVRTGGNGFQSFCLIQLSEDSSFPLVTYDGSEDCPASFVYALDLHDNVVAFGFHSPRPPLVGIRFDVIGKETGVIGETRIVEALSSVIPKMFVLLDDNTALTVSTVESGATKDLLIARTDTIPSGYYAPQPASVELLVEGPPAWGYRMHTGSYSQNQLVFKNLCREAQGNTSGSASSRWESGLSNFTVFFTADHAVPTNSVSDTLWLTAPECESVDIAWSMNGVDGMVKGPFHPEVNLQTFLCRLESFGVTARFDIADATNMDSIQVWRKDVAGTDSLKIETRYAVAGHHVVADHNVPVGKTWTYYLLAADRLGRLWSLPNASASIFADPTVIVPEDYQLALPYPNPFNASTTFSFDIPELSIVHLDIYDITGRLVTTLMDQSAPAGSYTKTFDASNMASGVYIYSFRANDFQKHGKILLLK